MFELNLSIKDSKEFILNILTELEKIPEISIFLEPITEDVVLNYKEIIKSPMDIQTIKQKLENNSYTILLDILLDFQTIWNNCRSFNKNSSSYYRHADKFDKKFFSLLKNHFGIAFVEKYEDYLIKNNIYFKDQNNRVNEHYLNLYSNIKSLDNKEDNLEKKINNQKLSILQGIRRLKNNNLSIFLNEIDSIFPKNYFKIINNEWIIKLDNDKKKLELIEKTIQNIINE